MFNPTLIVIEACVRELRAMYERTYTILEPNYPGTLSFAAQLALETIATSDAAYHDANRNNASLVVTALAMHRVPGFSLRSWGRDPARNARILQAATAD